MQTTTNQGGVMGGKHDIYIIEAEGEFLVRPAVTMIDGSQRKLKVRNLTKYPVFLTFPSGFLKGTQQTIPLGGEESTPGGGANLIPAPALLDGLFNYEVVIIKNGVPIPARGESAPKVIVDP
jgi:hypothetical protein